MKLALVAAVVLFAAATPARAQLVPNDDWRTIQTRHFRVHFTPPLEELARRAAINAERAYTELSTELVAPRGTIDLVVADNVDYVNGYATPFPSNRIVVYAHPPTDASGLRKYSDWNSLVITHELTHIFHLDRTRGIWRVGQALFGRNPLLFPNLYQPGWVIEGLAVYYESRLTGVGRLESSEHSMVARAAALADRLPTLQELSPGTSRFPGGEVVYVYGSLMFDYLSRTYGPGTVRDYVERGSKNILPFFLTPISRGAFGESFQTAWTHWRDSLVREMKVPVDVMPGWRQVTTHDRVAAFPRWLGDTAIVYAGDNGRDTPGAYEVTLGGGQRRLGRRNGTGPNVVRPDGSMVFAQLDYLDPYRLRTDLYVERNGVQKRITVGARLGWPDVRADGTIIAVQNLPGTTRLVRVSADGRTITPISRSALDTQYADPRWSPEGTRIAAVIQSRGTSRIVVLDETGKEIDSFGETEAINSGPSWSPDGRSVYFSSDRSGSSQIYVADATSFAPSLARVSDAPTGLFSPEVSPDRSKLASVLFKADGYHIGVAPLSDLVLVQSDSTRISPRAGCVNCLSIVSNLAPPGTADTSTSRRYSPWQSLRPTYWLPIIESMASDGTDIGATTSGYDIVGRHSYTIDAFRNTRFGQNSADLWYRYAGFGLPLVDFYVSQGFSNSEFSLISPTDTLSGTLLERQRTVSLQATFLRPRMRTYALASVGGELEGRSYSTRADSLFRFLPTFFQKSRNYPAIVGSFGWSNAQRPDLSISPEDGVSASLTGRQRWQGGTSGGATRSVTGIGTAYKSLDLPGFAHHVIALRAAGGLTDQRTPNLFHAGGISGNSLEVFPGFAVGQQRRTFGVRGYPAGVEGGIRAYAAAVEYRAPLTAPSRGFRFIPLFIDKTSLTLFGETGRAYCPSSAVTDESACSEFDADNPAMRSIGAELNIDTALQLEVQARIRLGVGIPLVNREVLGAKSAQFYGTFGASF
ncbi:MAG TPA: hypothetical protein VM166_08490 [Gemmatimonadaceae bacterium]|nr:hypothetical protein [Gemmatimonadaceae bacterium]